MNKHTRDAFLTFIDAVETLAASVMVTIGTETATSIIEQAEDLKERLQKDETIL